VGLIPPGLPRLLSAGLLESVPDAAAAVASTGQRGNDSHQYDSSNSRSGDAKPTIKAAAVVRRPVRTHAHT
jgi:hypothetical protein